MGKSSRYVLLISLCCCSLIPQYLCTGLNAEHVRFPPLFSVPVVHQSMCDQFITGGTNFPGIDIMSQFHIAELARRGILKKVAGPTPRDVAYEISPDLHFRINTRSVYPLRLPEEFDVVAVLRMGDKAINTRWNMWQVQDVSGDEQLALRLNGESKSLEFAFKGQSNGSTGAVFRSLGFLFDEQWHWVFVEIRKHSVALWVDCVMIGAQSIPRRQKVSLDGFMLMGKLQSNPLMSVLVCSNCYYTSVPSLSHTGDRHLSILMKENTASGSPSSVTI